MVAISDHSYQQLLFETEALGQPVARLKLGRGASASTHGAIIGDLVQDWRSQHLWLVSCRVDDHDAAAKAALSANDFRCIETLVTLERTIDGNQAMPDGISQATDDDCDACIQIGRRAFGHDRFHMDDRIDNDLADRVKANWVRNSLQGRADAALVSHEAGQTRGFVLCLHNGDNAIIDLIAVANDGQGRGIGGKLVAGALSHYRGRAKRMLVGTQHDNLASRALYERMGFVRVKTEVTYHWVNPEILS